MRCDNYESPVAIIWTNVTHKIAYSAPLPPGEMQGNWGSSSAVMVAGQQHWGRDSGGGGGDDDAAANDTNSEQS